MIYRPEIDGLRAIAVISVILFHAGFDAFSGGFVGVDIFFVISGYLITSILIEDIENKRFSLINFYERRTRRILPALFFMLICCLPFAWMWMFPNQMKDFSQSLAAVSLFASNFLFWKESGYFALASEEKPLIHTWSLAVEEQYYIFFPIFLFLFWRFGKNKLFWIIITVAISSFLLSEWGWRHKASANFYLAPTRAWELLAGASIAFIIQKQGVKNSNTLSLLGLLMIVISIIFFNKSTPIPSIYTLFPVFGATLVIIYAEKSLVTDLLSSKILVGIGLISYSTYLWHQPLFAFARIRSLSKLSDFTIFTLILASLALGFLSWKYIEKPFRDKNTIKTKNIWYLSFISIISIFSIGIYGHLKSGIPDRLDEEVTTAASFAQSINPYNKICHLNQSKNEFQHPLSGCTDFLMNEHAEVVFIGDSHSMAISHEVQKELKKNKISSYAVAYSSCIGLSGFYRVDQNKSYKCNDYNKSMVKFAKDIKAKTLVITSRFPLYIAGTRFNNKEGGIEYGTSSLIDVIQDQGQKKKLDSIHRKERVKAHMKEALENLLKEFNVIIIEPIPEVGWNVPSYVAKSKLYSIEDAKLSTSLAVYKERSKDFFDILNNINNKKLIRVSSKDIFCSEKTGRCNFSDEHGLFYMDDDHLSQYGAEKMAPYIAKAIEQSLLSN